MWYGLGLIYVALLVASRVTSDPQVSHILATLLIAGVPALLMGLAEDITKNVGVGARLLATVASGVFSKRSTNRGPISIVWPKPIADYPGKPIGCRGSSGCSFRVEWCWAAAWTQPQKPCRT